MTVLSAPLEYAFMRNGLLEVLLLGAACGLVGPFVVQRSLTFYGHALSHTLLPALVIGLTVGISAIFAAAAGALATAVLVHQLQRRRDIGEDSAVGVVFVGLFALGVVLLGWFRITSPDVGAAMVGNVLGIRGADLAVGTGLLAALAIAMLLLYRPLVLVSFDRLGAEALGLPVALLDLVVLGSIGATAVAGVKVVGVILTVAALVTPAAAARQWSASLPRNIALATLFAWVAGGAGLYAGYYLRVAPAAIIVLLLSALFAASTSARYLRRVTR